MIIYPDGPNINFVNSILEKDIFKRIPLDYSLNLLTSDRNDLEIDKDKIKLNNSNINANNIQRYLINLLNYENEQSIFQDKEEKEFDNFDEVEEECNNQKYNSNINKKEDSDLIQKNQEKGKLNNEIYKNLNDNNNYYNYRKDFQNNNEINPINNDQKNTNENENKGTINQHIYNNFNIPYINFIYNIGTNETNNNMENSNVNKSNINNLMNINNFNNRFINTNFDQITNIENPFNINDNFNNSLNANNYGKNIHNYQNQNIPSFQNNKNINNDNNINYFSNNYNYNQNNYKNKNKINQNENKFNNMSLQEIANKLDLIAKKKNGCKYLEKFLKTMENSSEIINKIFYPQLYWIKLYELSNDLFGNYFIQEIIPKLDTNNLISFTNMVVNNLLNLCLNPHGTRVVQILINTIRDNRFGLLLLLKNELSKIMGQLIYNLNGSFVLMHYAIQIKDNEMIYDFLNNNIVEIATNSYSCSALQKLIDIGTNQQGQKLIINIINNINYLIGNQCGLYVLQFIMNKKNYYINDAILGKIIDKIIFLSKRKFSSNVVEKCLETCSPESVNKLINIFNNQEIICDLIKDNFGNYVIQKLLIVCENEQAKSKMLKYISLEFKNLKEISFGQKLINKIIMAYPQIRKYL